MKLLERVVWNDAYSVGVEELDLQHRRLVDMINRLADCYAAANGEPSADFHEVVSDMFDYALVHFSTEEAHMTRIGYPDIAAHLGQHEAFMEKATEFNFAAADGIQDLVGVHDFLRQWLIWRITQSDMQYRRFTENKPT